MRPQRFCPDVAPPKRENDYSAERPARGAVDGKQVPAASLLWRRRRRSEEHDLFEVIAIAKPRRHLAGANPSHLFVEPDRIEVLRHHIKDRPKATPLGLPGGGIQQ